ncbi:Uu.00g062090.m01.CDS01 [Anthostomella pinea]|uniref:beta-N-acetylhexosaminidase n=1 Tax=Anthostomella pinea TaxID=933095 RepID=A0AAI8VT56_9PEZI|nr:Uu.00g062090.m01.CDS01 [Anthostomella pinea]
MLGAVALQPLPPVAPSLPNGSHAGFVLGEIPATVFITTSFASHRDSQGLSLIPPSGQEFAETFIQDLGSSTGKQWKLQVVHDFPSNVSGIFLGQYQGDPDTFLYEDGVPSEEGYVLAAGNGRVTIHGSGARGMWWGTRTLLQQLMISNWSSLRAMQVTDTPAYETRGFMLDAGRKWYSKAFLKELCTWYVHASFFKMNEFHYHTSDNYPLNRGHNETWNNVYAQFSLHPESQDLQGLVQRPSQTLSRAEFEELQEHCARRGITIIPEIEAPSHCLSITKWRPELALDKKDLLNLTHPDAIPTVKRIWEDFLPWFQTKEVHIGADEYDSTLADDYISFVNEMSTFINETSGKKTRIWGTFEPSNHLTISKDVVVQHWQYGQSDPVQLQADGYDVVNTEDWWAYMSLKNDHMPVLPAPYPQFFNESRILNFAAQGGWQWQPALFNPVNVTEQLADGARGNRGAIMAAWNDNGPDATTQIEAYYAMRRGIPLVAARAWNGARDPSLEASTIDASIDFLSAKAPGQNLDRRLQGQDDSSNDDVLVSWTRGSEVDTNAVSLGYGSKGMNYTLTLSVIGPFSLSSDDVILTLSEAGSLVFHSDGVEYPLRSVSEDDGFEEAHPGRIWANATTSSHKTVTISMPAEVTVTGDTIGGSRVWVDGAFVGRFEVFVFGGKNTLFSWSQMAFVAPLESLTGGVESLTLQNDVSPPSSSGEDAELSTSGAAAGPENRRRLGRVAAGALA